MADLTQAIAALLVWISSNTAYVDASRVPPPRVVVSNSEAMARICASCGAGIAPAAIYECGTRTITLDAGLTERPEQAKQFLVHELVHHAQCVAWGGYPRARECDAEREAYAAQARYIVAVYGDTQATRAHAERLAAIAERSCAATRR